MAGAMLLACPMAGAMPIQRFSPRFTSGQIQVAGEDRPGKNGIIMSDTKSSAAAGEYAAARVTFDQKLRADIAERDRAKDFSEEQVACYVKAMPELRFNKRAYEVVDWNKILRERLYLLSDDTYDDFVRRFQDVPKGESIQETLRARAAAQVGAAAESQSADSTAVPQSEIVAQAVAHETAGSSSGSSNVEANGGAELPPHLQKPETLVPEFSLDLLDEDAGIESRELHPQVVEEYTKVWKSGVVFKPIRVRQDGQKHYCTDGSHRVASARRAGRTHVPALVCAGTRLEALEVSLRSNHVNAERRTDADKKYSVEKALKEFYERSDRVIAEMCGVSPTFVGKRRELMSEPSTVHVDSSAKAAQKTRVGRDGKKRPAHHRKGAAHAKPPEQPATATQPPRTWKQSLRQLQDQAKAFTKALTPGVRQFRKHYPDEAKRLKPALAPWLGNLAKLVD